MKIEPLEYNLANELGVVEGNVVKYVTRWKDKGGIDDLRKARHYLDIYIEYLESDDISDDRHRHYARHNDGQMTLLYEGLPGNCPVCYEDDWDY